MARRTAKKSSTRPRNVAGQPSLEVSSPPANYQTSSKGSYFWKFFIFIIVVLVVLDFSNVWKKGFKLPKKFYLVKKVVQFTGAETAGKPFSAWGVAEVGPNQFALVDNSGCRGLIYDFNGKLIRHGGKLGHKSPYELHEPSSFGTAPPHSLILM